MKHDTKICKHCEVEYFYQMSGHGVALSIQIMIPIVQNV